MKNLSAPKVFGNKLSKGDIALFYRQMAMLMTEGTTFEKALIIFDRGYKNPASSIVSGILKKIAKGATLKDSLLKYPNIFSKGLVEILVSEDQEIEKSNILERMANDVERSSDILSKIHRATLYPKVILLFLIIFSFINLYLIVPVFEDMFAGLGGQLPGLTMLYVNFLRCIQDNIISILITIVVVYCMIRFTLIGRKISLLFIRFVPVLDKIFQKVTILKFARYATIFLSSKISFKDALKYAVDSVEHHRLSIKIRKMVNSICEKEDVLTSIEKSKIFPNSFLQTLYVGNQNDRKEEAWDLLTIFYEKSVDTTLLNFVVFIRVLSVLFLGFIVGIMVISFYLPIFSMAGSV